jgi:hypothetical protein
MGHTGSVNGFRAIALFRPDDGLGVIALANGSARPNHLSYEIASLVLEGHRAAAVAVPTAPPKPTPDAWRELLGAYQEDDYGYGLRIEFRSGALVIVAEDDPNDVSNLVASEDPLVFTVEDGEAIGERCVFLRNASGAIAGLNLGGGALHRLAPVER